MSIQQHTTKLWLFAALWAVLGIMPVIVLGLTVPGKVIAPMAMALGGLFASVAASWAGNGYAGDGSRSRLLAIIGITEIGAMLAAGLLLLSFLIWIPLSLLLLVLLFGGGIGRIAVWATARFRSTPGRRWLDAVLSVLLVLLGLSVAFGGTSVLCSTVVSCHA